MHKNTALLCLCLAAAFSCARPVHKAHIANSNIGMDFDSAMHTRITAHFGNKDVVLGPFSASEYIQVNGSPVKDFALDSAHTAKIATAFGKGERLRVRGISGELEKVETVDAYSEFPNFLFIKVVYRNLGGAPISSDGWTNCNHSLTASHESASPEFWSLEPGSYEKRPDWVVPLKAGFQQQNYLGMNASDYGGGTPVVDVWRRDVGLAAGHVELSPKLVSLPVAMPGGNAATLAVTYAQKQVIQSGGSLTTFQTFVAVHQGDYFSTLTGYRRAMIARGVKFSNPPADGFQPIWCAWGFGRNFKPKQILDALPVVKKLGFKWVTVDDGWQTAEGDWNLNPKKFPHGDSDMRALVNKIHAEGFKAQLWWSPMAVSPQSNLMKEHPGYLLLDEHGAKRKISWFDTFYLCPAFPAVVALHQQIAQKIIRDWGFDGLKIDGQFLNAVPRCTNPAHHHYRPEASVEAVPYFFKAIEDSVRSIKPDALIELCPCGTAYSFYSMPYYNMSVASDPESSWQVRSKGKTLKALMGNSLPYFGDHVELSDGGHDFASTVGVGGVVGSNFRWPPNDKSSNGDASSSKLPLTPQKQELWAKWIGIYRDNMLSKGEYLGGLYDIGFDKPETHCIRKDGALYYAFYAPSWSGEVELRGLGPGSYELSDYVRHKPLGTVHGPTTKLLLSFHQFLLIEAQPVPKRGGL